MIELRDKLAGKYRSQSKQFKTEKPSLNLSASFKSKNTQLRPVQEEDISLVFYIKYKVKKKKKKKKKSLDNGQRRIVRRERAKAKET